MKALIYHNPKCSKSRQTLALLEDHKFSIEVVDYLKTPPTVQAILTFCKQLGMRPVEIVRSKEAVFKEQGFSLSDERDDQGWAELLVKFPKLIERPIVVCDGRAVLGRPPENVLTLLGQVS